MKIEVLGGQRVFTPQEVADDGLIPKVAQWEARKKGDLKFLRRGRLIYYLQSHLDDYFKSLEVEGNGENGERQAA